MQVVWRWEGQGMVLELCVGRAGVLSSTQQGCNQALSVRLPKGAPGLAGLCSVGLLGTGVRGVSIHSAGAACWGGSCFRGAQPGHPCWCSQSRR